MERMVKMIKKIYIASSIIYKYKCQELSDLLENLFNITITRKWWDFYLREDEKIKDSTNSEFYSHPMVEMTRELDFKAIRDADLIIILNPLITGHPLITRYPVGSLIECGYAIAHNKVVIFLGTIRRSAMLSGCIHIETNEELIELIEKDTERR